MNSSPLMQSANDEVELTVRVKNVIGPVRVIHPQTIRKSSLIFSVFFFTFIDCNEICRDLFCTAFTSTFCVPIFDRSNSGALSTKDGCAISQNAVSHFSIYLSTQF
jgi:hypothetical protein